MPRQTTKSSTIRSTKTTITTKTTKQQSSQYSDTISNLLLNLHPKYSNQLSPNHHDAIHRKVNELLRVLNCKVHASQRLCQSDSPQARTLVVLERVLRQGVPIHSTNNNNKGGGGCDGGGMGVMTPSVRVPWIELGKLIGGKRKNIEVLANAVQPYLDQIDGDLATKTATVTNNNKRKMHQQQQQQNTNITAIPKASSSSLSSKSTATTGRRSARITSISSLSSTSSTTIQSHPQMIQLRHTIDNLPYEQEIQKLSIKLQSQLHDPDKAARLSEVLYNQYIQQYVLHSSDDMDNNDDDDDSPSASKTTIRNTSSQRGAGRLQQQQMILKQQTIRTTDLQRNFLKYIGAFFLISVNESEDGTLPSVGGSGGAGKGTKKRNTSNHLPNNKNGGGGGTTNEDGAMLLASTTADEETTCRLSIDDILHVLRLDKTQFVYVLTHVLDNLTYIREKDKVLVDSALEKKVVGSGIAERGGETKDTPNNSVLDEDESAKKKRCVSFNTVIESNDGNEDGSWNNNIQKHINRSVQSKDRYVCEAEFLRWRNKSLNDALMNARTTIRCSTEQGVDIGLEGEEISPSQLLKEAATQVAIKYRVITTI